MPTNETKDTTKIFKTASRINFDKKYDNLNDSQTLTELLFAQQLQIEKLEKIRRNTSILVWWLIAIPIVVGFFVLFFGGCAALLT